MWCATRWSHESSRLMRVVDDRGTGGRYNPALCSCDRGRDGSFPAASARLGEMSGASEDSASPGEPLVDLVLEEAAWADALPSLAEIAEGAARLAREEV